MFERIVNEMEEVRGVVAAAVLVVMMKTVRCTRKQCVISTGVNAVGRRLTLAEPKDPAKDATDEEKVEKLSVQMLLLDRRRTGD